MKTGRVGAMTEILNDLEIKLTDELISKIADDFGAHIDMEYEIESYQHVSRTTTECEECKKLKRQISDLSQLVNMYSNSLKRHTGAENIFADITNGRFDFVMPSGVHLEEGGA